MTYSRIINVPIENIAKCRLKLKVLIGVFTFVHVVFSMHQFDKSLRACVYVRVCSHARGHKTRAPVTEAWCYC